MGGKGLETRSRLKRILNQELSALTRQQGILAVGLVGSLRGEDLWEGSDIDLVLVTDRWEEATPAYDCRLRSGTIIHSTMLTREDLALRREEARGWVEECRILWDQERVLARAKNAWSRIPRAQKRPTTPREVYETEFARPAASWERGDLPSCLIRTRRAALRVSSSWLRGRGVTARAIGRRGLDQVISGLHGLGEMDGAACLLRLFQADLGPDEAGGLLNRMMAMSTTTHNYLREAMLSHHLQPSELGLLHHASTADELADFLEALYRPLATHYPRSMVACCQFSSAFLAALILTAQARRDNARYEEESLVRSLYQANLPDGLLVDFLHLQRFHDTQGGQRQAIREISKTLEDLIST